MMFVLTLSLFGANLAVRDYVFFCKKPNTWPYWVNQYSSCTGLLGAIGPSEVFSPFQWLNYSDSKPSSVICCWKAYTISEKMYILKFELSPLGLVGSPWKIVTKKVAKNLGGPNLFILQKTTHLGAQYEKNLILFFLSKMFYVQVDKTSRYYSYLYQTYTMSLYYIGI